jgi:subtilisin family serine protease
MKTGRRTILKGIAAGGLTLSVAGPTGGTESAKYLVSATGAGVRSAIEDAGFSVADELAGGRVFVAVGPEDDHPDLQDANGVEHVARDLTFELEEPEFREAPEDTSDEQLYGLQWDKQVTDVAAAHDTATGAGSRLAIIDTGIDVDHPDLQANVNADEGLLFRYGEVSHDDVDVYGHGSHVGGIAAAVRDGAGVVGTAPDAELVSLRVFYYDDIDGDGDQELTTTTHDILLAITHAADIGSDAANMSLGTPPLPPEYNATGAKVAYQRVIQDAVSRGTVVVASAGNSDADLQHGGYFTVPNSTAGAMSISATGPNDERTFYSNYGTNEIDVGAPGGGYETLEKSLASDTEWPYPTNLVLSTVPPELYGAYYAYFAGTSMAAPQVTGLAGLVREVAPDANANAVERAIKDGAELVDGESSADLGAGRVNADRTLDSL